MNKEDMAEFLADLEASLGPPEPSMTALLARRERENAAILKRIMADVMRDVLGGVALVLEDIRYDGAQAEDTVGSGAGPAKS